MKIIHLGGVMRSLIYVFLVLMMVPVSFAQDDVSEEIRIDELRTHIEYLASDSLKGRKPGTPEDLLAAEYIRDRLADAGFSALFDEGLQYFDLTDHIEVGDKAEFVFNGVSYESGKDFTPVSFSASEELEAPVVFTGYGYEIEQPLVSWHDYENVDVKDKWVMILRGSVNVNDSDDVFDQYASIRMKVLTARDEGAAGVLIVSGKTFDEKDELIALEQSRLEVPERLPIIHIKRYVADSILAESGKTIEEFEKIITKDQKNNSVELSAIVKANSDIERVKTKTHNVVMLLEGTDPELKNEYVVIGGHYDHLGFGGPGSGSREPDTMAVHNGADDNGSGIASIIEIGEFLAAHKNDLKRSVIVAAFSAEEMGLIGSKYFTGNSPAAVEDIVFMLNLDMVGRYDTSKTLTVGGVGTAEGWKEYVEKTAQEMGVKVTTSPEGYGPSDHASFYAENISVSFFFTGVHNDYHTPRDDIELLNFEGQKLVSDYIAALAEYITQKDDRFVYQEAGPKQRQGGKQGFKVTLGIMPNFANTDIKGLGVDAVIEGRPADLAGLKKGDIIVALDGKKVENIYDYMNRLKELQSGQRISVEVMRDGEKVILIVLL